METAKPKQIGTYIIKELVGFSARSQVYRATHEWTGMEAAVKLLNRGFFEDTAYRDRYEQEIRVLALYDLPPAVAPVDDFHLEGEQPFIVMRYFPGGNLAQKMAQGPLALEDAFWITAQVAFGLDFLHQNGILHQNLKPENILFDLENQPHLTDYGLYQTRPVDATGMIHLVDENLAYLSPEQILDRQSGDVQSDQYSLAAIAYTMLVGEPPFVHAGSELEQAAAQLTQPLPEIKLVRPELPELCDPVLRRALDKDPSKRYPSVIAFTRALGRAFGFDVSELGEPEPDDLDRQPVRRKPHLAFRLIGISVALILVAAAFLMIGNYIGLLNLDTIAARIGLAGFIPTPTLTATLTSADRASPTFYILPSYTPHPTRTPRPTQEEVLLTITLSSENVTMTAVAVLDNSQPGPTSTPQPLTIGGADKIAVINENEIWLANIDGSDPQVITQDKEPKSDLEWLPDGSGLLYKSDGCYYHLSYTGVTLDGNSKQKLVCAEDLAVSLNKRQMVYGNRVLRNDGNYGWLNYLADFSLERLANLGVLNRQVNGCFFEGGWQSKFAEDGKSLASLNFSNTQGRLVEIVQEYNIPGCGLDFKPLVSFPDVFFELNDYLGVDKPGKLNDFGWDGEYLFAVHGDYRNGFGEMGVFNTTSYTFQTLAPISQCCYQDIQWSPDRQYLLFVYLNPEQTFNPKIFYIPFGTIQANQTYQPLKWPDYFFATPKDRVEPALRPAKP